MHDVFGLIGHPLGHSFSRNFFTEKFAREGIDAEYINFDIEDVQSLRDIVREHPTLRGLNVTLPYKQAVIPLLDELSEEARRIGAVNVIRVSRDWHGNTHLKGFNSDVIGFRDSLRPLLQPHHTHALVLGTGGASRAICAGLDSLRVTWRYVSRTAEGDRLAYDQLTPEVMSRHTVIINCTPVGMFPKVDECPAVPMQLLTNRHLLYDLIYNPTKTRFLHEGTIRGAVTKNGLEMLRLQAVASWNFWHEQ
ncbi:MAG: shikimate dehydrogenase [Bacteroidaceae bacterium]|nr:shikimate dehydrogenase [Bacteroidaceae bacterium]